MTLAMPLMHPTRGNVLLRAGYVLDKAVIAQLHRLEQAAADVEAKQPGELAKRLVADIRHPNIAERKFPQPWRGRQRSRSLHCP